MVVGLTASGKTTMARRLAHALGAPYVELDALAKEPGWRAVPVPVLRDRMGAALAGDHWVCDGNYADGRDISWGRANALVWLDYPLRLVLFRRLKRTAWRLPTRERPSHGNREGITALIQRGCVLLRMLRRHRSRRREYAALLGAPAYRHLVVVRLESPAQGEDWLSALSRAWR